MGAEGWQEQRELLAHWKQLLRNGIDCDSWGQIDEAEDVYRSLYTGIKREGKMDNTLFNEAELQQLQNIRASLKARVQDEGGSTSPSAMSSNLKVLNQMERRAKMMLEQQRGRSQIDTNSYSEEDDEESQTKQTKKSSKNNKKEEAEEEEEDDGEAVDHFTSPITLLIRSINIKGAPDFIDPCIRVSIRDWKGIEISSPIKTRTGQNRKGDIIEFDHDFTLMSKAEFPRRGALFLEFVHYKPKEQRESTKCFAVLEKDEFDPGNKVLELYSKPVDFSRKKLSLFSKKDVFLRVEVSV